jgi:PhzF family phenazine biosynthesis protein
MMRQFRQVDVFTEEPFLGNPVAVVLDGQGLATSQMQALARWANLSETTFVLPATAPGADYRVRIFTPVRELPFAGHPTLGTCHAWLESGRAPTKPGVVVQQCQAGLVEVREDTDGLAFAAPPLVRAGPVETEVLERVLTTLGAPRAKVVGSQWADNGPGWVAVLLDSAEAVLSLRPGVVEGMVGVAGPYPTGAECAFEVRAFFPKDGQTVEDPVTGSFNASLAQWLLATGRARAPYVVSQGTVLGRRGRVHVSTDADGTVWVSGRTVTCVTGEVDL